MEKMSDILEEALVRLDSLQVMPHTEYWGIKMGIMMAVSMALKDAIEQEEKGEEEHNV